MTSDQIGGIVGSFLTGGVIATILTYILKSKKLTGDYRVGEVIRANLRIDKLENEIEECQGEREELKATVARHETRLAALTQVVERNEESKLMARVECDENQIITGWNLAAHSMFYFPPSEAIGASIDIIIPENRRDEHHASFRLSAEGKGIVKSGVGERTLEAYALTRDGEEIAVTITLSSYMRGGNRKYIAKIKRR